MKLFAAVILCIPAIVGAQTFKKQNLEVYCAETKEVADFLASKYNEKPVSVLYNDKTNVQFVITENSETKTWTLVFVPEDNKNVVCVVGDGYHRQEISK